MRQLIWAVLLGFASAFSCHAAPEQGMLVPQLEPFRPFLNIYWRGDLNQGQAKPAVDVSLWQRTLNGTAIKMTHSLNDGEYGGETVLFWDKNANSLKYFYFTTAGFYTQGSMTFDAQSGTLIAEEVVTGNTNGISKVRSTSKISAEKLMTQSEYFQNGQWVKGHSAIYHPDPNAVIKFQ